MGRSKEVMSDDLTMGTACSSKFFQGSQREGQKFLLSLKLTSKMALSSKQSAGS